jgi:hypothetical protein
MAQTAPSVVCIRWPSGTVEHTLECRKRSIDCRIGDTRLLPLDDVTFAKIRRDLRCRHVAEERLQVLNPTILKIVDRSVVVHAVILKHICIQF